MHATFQLFGLCMLLVVVLDLTNYVESMVLLICVVAYFVNVSGMFLSPVAF